MENKFDFKKYVDYKVYSVTTIKKRIRIPGGFEICG